MGYWEDLLESAKQGKPYKLMLVSGSAMLRGGNELSNEKTKSYVAHFGSSLPAVTVEISTKKSRRPVPGRLEPDFVSLRTFAIFPAVVKKFHPFQGDLTTTDLEKLAAMNGGKYDLIFCFNTMEYLNETERALAGINIKRALAPNGIFVTDNRFETHGGAVAKPIFETSFLDMAADVVTATGRHLVIYRKVWGDRPVVKGPPRSTSPKGRSIN